jgi:hypothetical protein
MSTHSSNSLTRQNSSRSGSAGRPRNRFNRSDSTNLFPYIPDRLPAMLDSEQTAVILGCKPHDIPALTRSGLLRPLGKPTQASVKFFAAIEVETLCADVKMLSKAKVAIGSVWKKTDDLEPKNPRVLKDNSRSFKEGAIDIDSENVSSKEAVMAEPQ